MIKTKFICTIGPSSSKPKIISRLIKEGMSIARLNFSHSTPEEHSKLLKIIRREAEKLNKPLGILQDLPGLKLRIGKLKKRLYLRKGDIVTLTTYDDNSIPVNFDDLPKVVKIGGQIFLSDGLIRLIVLDKDEKSLKCKVMNDGELVSGKGLVIPNLKMDAPSLTEKDIEYLKFGLKIGVDFIALSFVRNSKDVLLAKDLVKKDAFIISKIERGEALKNLDEIIEVSDGIMVARGDLGVDIGFEKIPVVQKEIIAKCNKLGKPVIVATQILDSMVNNPIPTRAEVTDIANAILDGADALMLSDETAIGKYPIDALKMLAKVSKKTEERIFNLRENESKEVSEVVSYVACKAGMELKVKALVAPTRSGLTARRLSKYRPPFPIIALTPNERVKRILCLFWGVFPYKTREFESIDAMLEEAERIVKEDKIAKRGDRIVIVSGDPKGIIGETNLIKVHRIM